MSEMYLLGIDNGGTVAKAAIVARDGRELAVAARKTESLAPSPGWVEFDAEALWQATAAAVRSAIDKAGIPPDKIAAVACTGHGNGVYLVDAAGASRAQRDLLGRRPGTRVRRALDRRGDRPRGAAEDDAIAVARTAQRPVGMAGRSRTERRQPNSLVPDVQGLHAHEADR